MRYRIKFIGLIAMNGNLTKCLNWSSLWCHNVLITVCKSRAANVILITLTFVNTLATYALNSLSNGLHKLFMMLISPAMLTSNITPLCYMYMIHSLKLSLSNTFCTRFKLILVRIMIMVVIIIIDTCIYSLMFILLPSPELQSDRVPWGSKRRRYNFIFNLHTFLFYLFSYKRKVYQITPTFMRNQ